jgi:hypothetical protein
LTEADLTGAVMERAILTGAILSHSIWSKSTYWPAGTLSEIRARSIEIAPDKFRIRGSREAKASPHPAGPCLPSTG